MRLPGMRPRNTDAATPACLAHASVWALARSIAPTSAVSIDFFSSGYLDVSVPPVAGAFAPQGLRPAGSPIRTPRDQGLCAAPPGLSRLSASFVGPLCLGIHRTPVNSSLPGRSPGKTRTPYEMGPDKLQLTLLQAVVKVSLCGSQGALGDEPRELDTRRCMDSVPTCAISLERR